MTAINSCDEKKKKKTLGKRKIEIKKIEKSSNRYVTFSKRRAGLFKKAAELCIVSGAQVGILVQSIGGNNVFTFGHPDVESVIDRYQSRVRVEENPRFSTHMMRHNKQEYDAISKALEVEEKEKKKIIDESNKGNFWWNMDVENLGFEEIEKHLTALEELKRKVMVRADELMFLESSSKSIMFSDLTAASAPETSGDCFIDQVAADGGDFSFIDQVAADGGDYSSIDQVAADGGDYYSFLDNAITEEDVDSVQLLRCGWDWDWDLDWDLGQVLN